MRRVRGGVAWSLCFGATLTAGCLTKDNLLWNALDDEGGTSGSSGTTASTTGTTSSSTGTQGATSASTTSDGGSTTSGTAGVCGDGGLDVGEQCDDGNTDPADGCLQSCERPRSCAHALAVVADAPDGAYVLYPSVQDPVTLWCDMTRNGGGWTLIAKVQPADMDTPAEAEPRNWFGTTREETALQSVSFELNGPLASVGAPRVSALIGVDSLARFDLVAADDRLQQVSWFKQIKSSTSFEGWFDDDAEASQVCTDPPLTKNCSMGIIAGDDDPANNPTPLEGMDLQDYGFTTDGFWIHMRLENAVQSVQRTGVCSSTLDFDSNAWQDSYRQHWGNALLIWLRE